MDIPRGANLTRTECGILIQGFGRSGLWEAVPHLGEEQAMSAARQVEEMDSTRVSFSDSLKEEKWSESAGLIELFRRPSWRSKQIEDLNRVADVLNSILGRKGPSAGQLALQNAYWWLILERYSKKEILGDYTSYMEQAIPVAARLYASHLTLPPLPDDPIADFDLSGLDRARFRAIQNETQNRLLAATLALQAYRLDHGRYPDSLSELAPRCLSRVPDDPFGLNTSLRYRRVGTSYLLYSVGPDGKDDDGTPIKAVAQGRRAYSMPESKGDIVAGINRS
jgi:hypothetical protein